MLSFRDYKDRISKSVHYHIENNIPFAENIYRVHSEEFYKLFREARNLYNEGLLTELTLNNDNATGLSSITFIDTQEQGHTLQYFSGP